MFLVLVLTGVLLMFYYVPSSDLAYQSMKDIEASVTFGQLMRNMHRWSAQGMVIAVFLHMGRVFYTGSYKPPREFNWVIGVLLLVVTFLLSFTGYLLPWDQLAYWAITVGTNIGGAAPIVGPKIDFMLKGGKEIGQPTLIRFYTLHVIFLPLIAAFLMAVHFWRIRKDGGISGPL
jgi:quinol-cytochrome oxidoreductase complex cytochrome b subunit